MRDLENCQLPSKFCSFCSIKGNGITRIDDIREITDENDKKEWALDRSLGNSRCNVRPGRVLVINDDSLITIREVVCTPV